MAALQEIEQAIAFLEHDLKMGGRPKNEILFQEAVRAWCARLGWDPAAGIELSSEKGVLLGQVAARFVGARAGPTQGVHSNGTPIQDGGRVSRATIKMTKLASELGLLPGAKEYAEVCDTALSSLTNRDYLLIALGVAAGGYVAFRIRTRAANPPAPPYASPALGPPKRVLILVVNAGREGVLDTVRTGLVQPMNADDLYQATQSLWVGSELDFERSKLAEWFAADRAVTEPSEYDVHLVRIEISEDSPGLRRNANQVDRIDALRRVAMRPTNISVSARLPSDAYNNPDLYPR